MKPALSVSAVVLCLAVTASAAQSGAVQSLAAARDAIGGDAKVLAIKSLLLVGTYRTTQAVITNREGVTRVSDREWRLEIRMLFPDHYLRIETDEHYERRAGFAGGESLREVRPLDGGQVSSNTWSGDTKFQRQNSTQILAGLLGRTDPLPEVKAVMEGEHISLTGPDDFRARLELDGATRRPVRLIHRARVTVLQPGAVLKGRGSGAGPSTAPEDDIVMTFGDRRSVGGVLVPHLITTSAKGVTLSEMRFDKVTVNPKLTAADFRK